MFSLFYSVHQPFTVMPDSLVHCDNRSCILSSYWQNEKSTFLLLPLFIELLAGHLFFGITAFLSFWLLQSIYCSHHTVLWWCYILLMLLSGSAWCQCAFCFFLLFFFLCEMEKCHKGLWYLQAVQFHRGHCRALPSEPSLCASLGSCGGSWREQDPPKPRGDPWDRAF